MTIFGESAGAVSVYLHILSPPAKGLFRAGILQSRTALLSYEKFTRKATEKQGRKVLEALGCADSEEKLFCLQSPNVEAFIGPELAVSLAPQCRYNTNQCQIEFLMCLKVVDTQNHTCFSALGCKKYTSYIGYAV